MKQTRGLSKEFTNHLKEKGFLHPLLSRVQRDTTLEMEIRENYINVYYRGGSLLKVAPAPRQSPGYLFTFNQNYSLKKDLARLDLPPSSVVTAEDTERWVDAVPFLKDTMDLWFGRHPKDERALQQMVVWENNDSPWANGTDWFIVDIEYDNHHGARFDLVGLQWDSVASARKLSKGYRPRLTIIEMKAGDGAMSGKAGISAHLGQLRKFLNDPDMVRSFKSEMLNVFEQKRDLELIRSLKTNPNKVCSLDPEINLIFLIVGHDPASRKLGTILREFRDAGVDDIPNARVSLCTANFMGFGLYRENVHELASFLDRHSQQIGG